MYIYVYKQISRWVYPRLLLGTIPYMLRVRIPQTEIYYLVARIICICMGFHIHLRIPLQILFKKTFRTELFVLNVLISLGFYYGYIMVQRYCEICKIFCVGIRFAQITQKMLTSFSKAS